METSEVAGKHMEDVRPGQTSSLSSSRLSEGEIAMPNDDKQTQLAAENVDVNSKSRQQEDQNLGNTSSADNVESPYRIPSSVFKRNASQTPMEWSVASNESLFSIHMGNMSFTRDQAFLGKSGELGLPGDMSASVLPFRNYSSKRVPSTPSPASNKYNAPPIAGFETIKENDVSKETPKKKSHPSASFRRSDASGASVKSFAFPILTDSKGDNCKQNASSCSLSQPQTPKVSQEAADAPQKPQLETPNPGTNTKPPSTGGLNRWFACLPCCNSSRS